MQVVKCLILIVYLVSDCMTAFFDASDLCFEVIDVSTRIAKMRLRIVRSVCGVPEQVGRANAVKLLKRTADLGKGIVLLVSTRKLIELTIDCPKITQKTVQNALRIFHLQKKGLLFFRTFCTHDVIFIH